MNNISLPEPDPLKYTGQPFTNPEETGGAGTTQGPTGAATVSGAVGVGVNDTIGQAAGQGTITGTNSPGSATLPTPQGPAGNTQELAGNRFLTPSAFISFVVNFNMATLMLLQLRVQENQITAKELRAIGEIAESTASLVLASAKAQADMELFAAVSHAIQGGMAVGSAVRTAGVKSTARKQYGKEKIQEKKEALETTKKQIKDAKPSAEKTKLEKQAKQQQKELDNAIATEKNPGIYNSEKATQKKQQEKLDKDKELIDKQNEFEKANRATPPPLTDAEQTKLNQVRKERDTMLDERGMSEGDIKDLKKNYKTESKKLENAISKREGRIDVLERRFTELISQQAQAQSHFAQFLESSLKAPWIVLKGNIDADIERYRGFASIAKKSMESSGASSQDASQMIKALMDALQQISRGTQQTFGSFGANA